MRRRPAWLSMRLATWARSAQSDPRSGYLDPQPTRWDSNSRRSLTARRRGVIVTESHDLVGNGEEQTTCR